MDLSLIPTDELMQELIKRFGIEIMLVLDPTGARDYFEGDYDIIGPKQTPEGV